MAANHIKALDHQSYAFKLVCACVSEVNVCVCAFSVPRVG
jgi:hypothetical protein